MKLSQVAPIAAGGAILLALVGVLGANAIQAPKPTAVPAVSVYEVNGYAEAPEKVAPAPVVAAEPAPVVEEAPVAPEPSGPTLCPEGTVAGAVDDAGNESYCQPLNDQGQECNQWNDANECVGWYKP